MDSWMFRLFLVSLINFVACKNDTSSSSNIEYNKLINTINFIKPQNLLNSMINSEINNKITINNTKCNIHLKKLSNDTRKFESWALKMLDSSSKIPSGILKGNLKDLGMWDECHSIKIQKDDESIQGRHCMYTVNVREQNTGASIFVSLSICLPDTCEAGMIKESLSSLTDMVPRELQITPTVTSVKCSQIDSEPWSVGAIIVIICFVVFLIILIIITICDVYQQSTSTKHADNLSSQIISNFSMYNNAKKILSMKVPSGNLPAIQGIRFFSMSWVVLGHEYFLLMMSATINQAEFINYTHSWAGIYVLIAPFSVDTFFAISGFLTSYLFMKEIWKGRKFNPIMYYIHRYWRLTPPVGVLLLFMIFICRRMGSGALWENNIVIQENACANKWWALLLYVQNYQGSSTMNCLGHTWYLAVDMQLFWLSPFILYPLAKRPKIGLTILAGLFVASIIIPAIVSVKNEYSGGAFTVANISGILDMMENYYIVSYTRAGPWLIGIYVGYEIAKKNNKKPSLIFVWFGWIMTVLAFSFCIFSYRIFQVDYKFINWWEAFYAGFARHTWACGICWIIYASIHGFGGVISTVLSLPIFLPLSRISYSIYLIHYVYEYMRISAIRSPVYFDDIRTIQTFLGDYVAIILISFLFCLVFESPFVALEKIILGTNKTKKPQKKSNDDEEVGEINYAYNGNNNTKKVDY